MNLVVLNEHTLLDVPATLRSIAHGIENNIYGTPNAAVVILDADLVNTFFMGMGAHPGAEAYLLMGLAMSKMARETLDLKE